MTGTGIIPQAGAARLLSDPDRSPNLAGHLLRHGQLPGHGSGQILTAVEQSGLAGRGGAGFPTARKMRAVLEPPASGRRSARQGSPVVVANGCEGEPASSKDKTLLTTAPHLVLDGIVLAARAVGAAQAHLCLHEDDGPVIQAIEHALAERRAAGIDSARVQVTLVPHRYVASEESALVRRLNGGPALPAFTPPRPFERGVGGRATLVNNVETLANLALIARHGPDWFRTAGTADAPGTTLVTVSGAVAAPGVYEIPLGITGQELFTAPVQAVLAGGYFGAWLPAARAMAARITPAGLAAAGAALGAGIFVALPAGSCGLAETARVARYLAEQSAGQCGPCVNGLPALATGLEALASRGDRRAPEYLAKIAPYVTGRGACRHPDGATRLIASALTAFAPDVRAHLAHGPCAGAAGVPILPTPASGKAQ
jgi:NADH:ubiquinone oxidoreductase subunit F (NADH-binding)